MFLVLTPGQRAKWNTPILQAEVDKLFESLDLTDAQREQIRAMCELQAKRLSIPVSAQTTGNTIKAIASQVNLRILTREQRQKYAKERAVGRESRGKRG